MYLAIHRFDIIQEGIDVWQYPGKILIWRLAASINRYSDSISGKFFRQFFYVVHIRCHHLAAG